MSFNPSEGTFIPFFSFNIKFNLFLIDLNELYKVCSQLKRIISISLLLFLSFGKINAQKTTERVQWFVNDRFGMFIHFGLYSAAEGYWHGEKIRNNNNYAEWIQYRNRIDTKDYISLINRIQWDEIDPEQWVLLAKKAGMKYLTITAKHHDGFALWDSKVSDYDLGNYTSPKRDLIKELSVACKKHGIKLGLYYSHWIDWQHKYGWDHNKELSGLTQKEYDQYWQEKVIPQVRELLTNYGDISIMWFDMWIPHSKTIVTKKQLLQLKDLIRELQPNCLINSRLGLSVDEDNDIDFRTLGDNQLGKEKLDYPWQTAGTVAHSWGFHATENQWNATSKILQNLINNVSLNGNYMLNIGPRANGEIPYEITDRFEKIGNWLKTNGESVYKSGAFDLRSDLHDWGRITTKTENGKTKIYLHVFNWPLDKQLRVTAIQSKPSKIYLLKDKLKTPIPFTHQAVVTRISLPVDLPDPYVSVLVMEFDHKPEIVKGLVGESTGGGYALTPLNTINSKGSTKILSPSRYGTIPQRLIIEEDSKYTWKIYFDKPGTYKVDASYSFQEEKPGKDILLIKTAGQELKHKLQITGKTVGEPNSAWVIDSFNNYNTGSININKPGFYNISLEVKPKDNHIIKFNRLWIEEK